MEETAITKREEAYIVHNRIITNGKIVQSALIDMCKDLKHMRDNGLYSELGYDSFESYAEQACGIKQRQAYSYISAYEKLGEDYIKQNSQLGITKLELISQISSYEREEFLESSNVEELSTRELKKQVEDFKSRVEQLSFEVTNANREKEDLIEQIKNMQDSMINVPINGDADVVVGTVEPDSEIIKAAVDKAVKQANEDNAELIKKLKAQVKEQKNKVKAVTDSKEEEIKKAEKNALDSANKKIDKLVEEKKVSDKKLQEALKAAKTANADEDVIAIRFLFSDLQSTANKINEHLINVSAKNQEQAKKLKSVMENVLKTIIENM